MMEKQRITLILILVLAVWLAPHTEEIHFPVTSLTIVTHSGKVSYAVELAITEPQQELGLMHRKAVPDQHGMFFDFGTPHPITMWMKDTLIPLDMLFIDNRGIITKIVANAPPESTDLISSDEDVRAVLELAGGEAKRQHIAKGDKVLYSAFP